MTADPRAKNRRRWALMVALPIASVGAAAAGWTLFGPVPDYLASQEPADESTIRPGWSDSNSDTRSQEPYAEENVPPRSDGGGVERGEPSTSPSPDPEPDDDETTALDPIDPPSESEDEQPPEEGSPTPSPPDETDDDDSDNGDDGDDGSNGDDGDSGDDGDDGDGGDPSLSPSPTDGSEQ
ncbi:hypothetical protein [Haloglycomyces albus]|uniref:hypothetical protein n=1 Tax=Haloglycomyces albus TaxID=526067 RepID=UPI00046D1997|nr:hypothetical protein [Haloglycomyces albus]